MRLPSAVETFEREREALVQCSTPSASAAHHSSRGGPADKPASPARSLPAQGGAGEPIEQVGHLGVEPA